jgi:DNA modification methylase
MRRLDSMTTPPLANGKDYRVGDCREVLSDISDESIPLIMTDPPYEDAAEPLWLWLADFAKRVLAPAL